MIHGDHWHRCTWNGVGGMEVHVVAFFCWEQDIYIYPIYVMLSHPTYLQRQFAVLCLLSKAFQVMQVCGQLTGQFETQPSTGPEILETPPRSESPKTRIMTLKPCGRCAGGWLGWGDDGEDLRSISHIGLMPENVHFWRLHLISWFFGSVGTK